MDLKRYDQLKQQADRARRDHDRAEGALGQLLGKLKADHGCGSIEDARALLKRLGDEVKREGQAFEKVMEDFEAEWGEQLKGER